MTSKTGANDNSDTLRIYQVTFAQWGEPVCVVARGFKKAAEIATGARGTERDARSMLVWDMTDDWKGVSKVMHGHTEEALDQGRVGIAVYDEELGWSVGAVEERDASQ